MEQFLNSYSIHPERRAMQIDAIKVGCSSQQK
jgi:hypothetical protein